MRLNRIEDKVKQFLFLTGILVWIGVTGPDVYADTGLGCLTDETGRILDEEETKNFLDKFFYSEEDVDITYKSKLLEWLQR